MELCLAAERTLEEQVKRWWQEQKGHEIPGEREDGGGGTNGGGIGGGDRVEDGGLRTVVKGYQSRILIHTGLSRN